LEIRSSESIIYRVPIIVKAFTKVAFFVFQPIISGQFRVSFLFLLFFFFSRLDMLEACQIFEELSACVTELVKGICS